MYGVGLALTFDEFGLWFHLGGSYWQRASFDAVVVIGGPAGTRRSDVASLPAASLGHGCVAPRGRQHLRRRARRFVRLRRPATPSHSDHRAIPTPAARAGVRRGTCRWQQSQSSNELPLGHIDHHEIGKDRGDQERKIGDRQPLVNPRNVRQRCHRQQRTDRDDDERRDRQARLGRLRKGLPVVRITKSTSVWVASDSTNHPVWNSARGVEGCNST